MNFHKGHILITSGQKPEMDPSIARKSPWSWSLSLPPEVTLAWLILVTSLLLKTIISPLTRIPKPCRLVLPVFWTFNKENPIVCILQCLTSFAQHCSWNSGIFVAGSCRWFMFIAVYYSIKWLALFLCAFSCWWPFGLFTVWDGYQKMLLWSLSDVPRGKLMCVCLCTCPRAFCWAYLVVESWHHILSSRQHCQHRGMVDSAQQVWEACSVSCLCIPWVVSELLLGPHHLSRCCGS